MTTQRSNRETKLSLTKLFLPTTPYVVLTRAEALMIRGWLESKASRTSNLNNQDRAAIKLDCYLVGLGPDLFAIPTGHLNEIRTGFCSRTSRVGWQQLSHYTAILAAMQTEGRQSLRGDRIREIKRLSLFGGEAN